MARVEYALLCHAAMLQENGLLSILGGGVSRVDGPQLPLRLALTLAARIEWDEQELGSAHAIRILVEHSDGERLGEVQAGFLPVRLPDSSPNQPVSGVIVIPLPLDIRRSGMYFTRISVNASELKAVPLEVEVELPQA